VIQTQYIFTGDTPQTITHSNSVTIKKVTTTEEFQVFYHLPWTVYHQDVYWVPPIWQETKDFFNQQNPFWSHAEAQLFIAYINNKPVGRIVGIIDHNFVKVEQHKIGYFGFFECRNDPVGAHALFTAVHDWLHAKKMTVMRGPINGRIDLCCGFMLQGFNEIPYLTTGYNPPYYNDLATSYGLHKATDLVSYKIDLTKPIPKQVQQVAQSCQQRGVCIRPFHRWRLPSELQTWWYDLLSEVFKEHWGYAPASFEEIRNRFGIKELPWIMKPRLFLVAEVDGTPIGFRWSMPDYNVVIQKLKGAIGLFGMLKFLWYKRRVSRGKFIMMGIKKDYRGQGIGTCLNYHTLVEMKRLGYTSAEYGWIEEHNIASRKAGEKIGGTLFKIYRIYETSVQD